MKCRWNNRVCDGLETLVNAFGDSGMKDVLEEAETEKTAALEEHRLIKIYFNQLKELSDYR